VAQSPCDQCTPESTLLSSVRVIFQTSISIDKSKLRVEYKTLFTLLVLERESIAGPETDVGLFGGSVMLVVVALFDVRSNAGLNIIIADMIDVSCPNCSYRR